jgi:hypothetical protein
MYRRRVAAGTAIVLKWAVPISIAVMVALQLADEQALFHHANWLTFADQAHYMDAARAWARWNLDASQHHYPPGYPLMGAPFVWLLPQQPFLIPDLVCAAISLVVFTSICQRLAPVLPHVRAAACVSFVVGSCGGHEIIGLWAQPWTTTAECPFLLITILLMLRFASPDRLGREARDAAAIGLSCGLGMMVRPTDPFVLLLAACPFLVVRYARTRPAWPAIFKVIVSGGLALALALLPFAAAHVMIFGLGASDYLGGSAAYGFEWRLIPMRWVTLFVGPRPLYPEGIGMVAVFIWIWPGVAGMLLASSGDIRRSAANAIVATTIVAYWLFYLSYRDLHPYGLWRFHNAHYFKWTLPFLVFWAWHFVRELSKRGTAVRALAAASLATLLFTWRPEFVPGPSGPIQQIRSGNVRQAVIPASLSSIDTAIMLQMTGDWHDLYFVAPNALGIAGHVQRSVGDVKLFPGRGGAMLIALRQLPAGSLTYTLPASVTIPPGARWLEGKQNLVFGLPCVITPRLGSCVPGDGNSWRWLKNPTNE